MADLLEIWNRALGHVGDANTIADEGEENAQARAVRRMWPIARDAVLAAHHWRFAERTILATPYSPVPPGKWALAYLYPSDALHIRHLDLPKERVPVRGVYHDRYCGETWFRRDRVHPEEWEVGGVTSPTGIDTQLILTDAELATITYTRRVEDATRYPVWVADVMAWKLAFDIAVPLSVSRETRAEAWKVYLDMMDQAMQRDARQQRPEPQRESDLISARW